MVFAKRIYQPAAPGDGYRVLIDGLWPRGLAKDAVAIDEWMKEIAPSQALRKWFGHEAERWPEFRRRYRNELQQSPRIAYVKRLRELAAQRDLTLLFAARDAERCNAAVIKEILTEP